jgi:hypothetical protein
MCEMLPAYWRGLLNAIAYRCPDDYRELSALLEAHIDPFRTNGYQKKGASHRIYERRKKRQHQERRQPLFRIFTP